MFKPQKVRFALLLSFKKHIVFKLNLHFLVPHNLVLWARTMIMIIFSIILILILIIVIIIMFSISI